MLCLLFVALVTVMNLRGVKESGKVFAYPTYLYIVTLSTMLIIGLGRAYFGHIDPVPLDPNHAVDFAETGGTLSLFVLLKGFSSGAVALTGVEAISNGVPAFREPASKNAAATLVTMGCILGTLFFGMAVLAHHLQPFPSEDETVLSQMGHVVFGGGVFYWVLQLATVGILVLAANTAYADFPRLSSIIASDGFLPKQFANRGDRLVFSNGVVFLGVAASVLLIAFGGITSALIPLYAIGVFTSFTISQAGMFVHLRRDGRKGRSLISLTGSIATGSVALIVATTKFRDGAYLPIIVVPGVILMFRSIRRHYDRIDEVLRLDPATIPRPPERHTFVVLVSRVHRGVVEAINYSTSLRPDHLTALHVADGSDHTRILKEWENLGFEIPLDVIDSPYRDLTEPVEAYLDALDRRWSTDRLTVVIPEFVVGVTSVANLLHGQSALSLKLALLDRPNTIILGALSTWPRAGAGPWADRSHLAVGVVQARLARGTDELERLRLGRRFTETTTTGGITAAPERVPVKVTGEVTSSRVVPRSGSPSLEITLSDGSGTVLAVFNGRRQIVGLEPGRAATLEGVGRIDGGQLVLVNPAYTLL